MSQKASDCSTLPMCYWHHGQLHLLGKRFWEDVPLDREALIQHYQNLYKEQGEKINGEQ